MWIEDDLLWSMAQRGDRAAVVRFAKRWWTPVYRFALNMLGNAAQAAVVTEETVFVLLQPGGQGVPLRIAACRHALHFSLLRRRWARAASQGPSSIRGALQRLSDLDRAALLLRDVELLPVEEVAAILRTTPRGARDRAHRGRLAMMAVSGAGSLDGLPETG